jgi:phosphatidylinositol kinase/protein kinase (PI-3  family)
MGITGTEGVFRRCCEETMKVLRHNHEAILTIGTSFVLRERCFSFLFFGYLHMSL